MFVESLAQVERLLEASQAHIQYAEERQQFYLKFVESAKEGGKQSKADALATKGMQEAADMWKQAATYVDDRGSCSGGRSWLLGQCRALLPYRCDPRVDVLC